MLYFEIFITIILLSVVQLLFIFSFRRKEFITKHFHNHRNLMAFRWVLILVTLLLFVSLYLFLRSLSSPHPDHQFLSHALPAEKYIQVPGIKEINHTVYTSGENFYYLYALKDISQPALQKNAQYLRDNVCIKPCTINFYDDKKAYEVDFERITITSTPAMQQWNKENYVFVANHYLGYLPFAPYSVFVRYPFKDWYYQSLIKR